MKVTLIQMNSINDKEANLRQATSLIEDALTKEKPDLLVLPEIWTFQGGTIAQAQASAEPAESGEAYRLMRDSAKRHGIHICGGSINEREGDKVFNTSFVFDPDGRQVARYRKIHLFDMLGDDGSVYKESALYTRGSDIVTFPMGNVTVGCAICYDLRFAELFKALRRQGADVILLPSAFTLTTGLAHWEALCRARAIETQTYFLATNQVGSYQEDGESRANLGHSMIVGPWGHVMAKAQDQIGSISATLDFEYLRGVRERMPVESHRVLKA